MASRNALFILSLLAMISLITSKVAARDFPETSSNSKAVEVARKTNYENKVGNGMTDVDNGMNILGEGKAKRTEESKINHGLDGVGGAGHENQQCRPCCYGGFCTCC